MINYNPRLKKFARENRNNPTKAEQFLWYQVLSGDKLGHRFLRQKPLTNFIADFYCHKLKLVIEIDGDSHDNKYENYDLRRTQSLKKVDLKVIRYTNEDVLNNIESVWEDLERQIKVREEELDIKSLPPSL